MEIRNYTTGRAEEIVELVYCSVFMQSIRRFTPVSKKRCGHRYRRIMIFDA